MKIIFMNVRKTFTKLKACIQTSLEYAQAFLPDIAENNMEIAAANVEEGVVELKKAESIVVRASKQIRL